MALIAGALISGLAGRKRAKSDEAGAPLPSSVRSVAIAIVLIWCLIWGGLWLGIRNNAEADANWRPPATARAERPDIPGEAEIHSQMAAQANRALPNVAAVGLGGALAGLLAMILAFTLPRARRPTETSG